MSKKKPNINVPVNTRGRIKDLANDVFDDMWIYSYVPDLISHTNGLFAITLQNKKFVFDLLGIDDYSDYVEIYFQGINVPSYFYSIYKEGDDIIGKFTETLALNPDNIDVDDFLVKGKIVEI